MLSRISSRAVTDLRPCLSLVRASSSTAAGSERDEVNFPKPQRLEHPGKVRMGFLPEEWFTFFHSKTGVTGPYVFGGAFLTFLYSKEILIMEHEFYVGLSEALMIIFAAKKFGPSVAAYLDKEVDEYNTNLDAARDGNLKNLEESIKNEETMQWQTQGQAMLFEAKKENVGLQLEAAYRERVAQAHIVVKKRLDFQLETANVMTRLEQKHMVNWIVNGVKKAITPTQETAALKQCIGDLNMLARA